MTNQTPNSKTNNSLRIKRIRRNRRKMRNLRLCNLQLWIAIFADLTARLSRFLWKYRKVIVRSLISITLIVSTIMIVGTFTILGVLSMAISFVEDSGYAYGWQTLDIADYNRLIAIKDAFVSSNSMAGFMSGMGATFWGSLLRMLMPFGIVAITCKWFAPLFKKN